MQFLLDYARYRLLGFDMVESIDLAMSRAGAAAHTSERLARDDRAREKRAGLRLVHSLPPAADRRPAAAPVSREWGGSGETAAGEKKLEVSVAHSASASSDVANKAFSATLPRGLEADGRRHSPQLGKEGDL